MLTGESNNDYFIVSVVITVIAILTIFGGCLYIRHVRGDNSYASMHNISKIVEAKK